MRGKEGSTIVTISVAVFLMLALLSPICHSANEGEETTGTPAGWSDNINLSYDPANRDRYPTLALNGSEVHVVWEYVNLSNSQTDILYTKSSDNGVSWEPTQSLEHNNLNYLGDTEIALHENNLHVVWENTTGWDGVFYRNSTDGGQSWNPKIRISPSDNNAGNPNVFVNNSNVHLIWHDFRIGTNGQVFYRRSLDGGITFENGQGVDEDRQITSSPADIGGVNMGGEGSNISVVWYDERNGNWDIYWMISRDNGFTWEDGLGNIGQDRRISINTRDSVDPAVAINGSNIHVVWIESEWNGPFEDYYFYYRNSTDNGVTWNSPVLLAGPVPGINKPDIDVEGDHISVVWDDERDDGTHDEIYYKNSTDGGITWSGDLRLTFNLSRESYWPRIDVNEDFKHVVWFEYLGGNLYEIYYKRSPDFPPDPTYNITLDEGWNLISLPLEQRDESISEVLSSIDGKWDIIQTYDPLSPEPWKSYNIYRPDSLNDFNTLNHKVGFWINITEPGGVNLTVSGTIPASTNINLYAGCWNLVGYPTLTNETVANALFGTTADQVLVGDVSEPYHIKEAGPAYVMKPGEGYWVHVVADTVWVVDW